MTHTPTALFFRYRLRLAYRAFVYLRPVGLVLSGVDRRCDPAGRACEFRRVVAAAPVLLVVLLPERAGGRVERTRRRAGIDLDSSDVAPSLFLPSTPVNTLTIGAICPTVLTTFCTVVTVLNIPSSPPKRSTKPFNSSIFAYFVKLARLNPPLLEAGLASFSFTSAGALIACAG